MKALKIAVNWTLFLTLPFWIGFVIWGASVVGANSEHVRGVLGGRRWLWEES